MKTRTGFSARSILAACIAAALPGLAFAQATEEVGTADGGPVAQSAPGPLAIWLPPADVLFNSGPAADGTEATCSADAGNASLLETALSNTTLGFGAGSVAALRVADDFVVPAGPGWNATNAYVFSYQTGSTTTSTFTATNFRIWNGSPADPGSTIICGDGATNAMTATEFSGIYRMATTTIGCTRPLMVETISLAGCPTLAPGTYWLDWQLTGSLASGPWAPPIAALGQVSSGDGLQQQAGVWGPAIDAGANSAQGFPFLIAGTSASSLAVNTASATATDQCATAPAQNNGVVEPGEHVMISVPVDAVGGNFTAVNASLGLPAPAGVTYVTSSAVLGDISAGNSATANFEVAVDGTAACLTAFDLPIAVSSNEGNAAGTLNVPVGDVSHCSVCVDAADLIFRDGFEQIVVH